MFRQILVRNGPKCHSKLPFQIANFNQFSPLEKLFNARPAFSQDTPTAKHGLFNIPELTSPEGFYTLSDTCIHDTNRLIASATDPSRNRKMVHIFDQLSNSLCKVADLSEFIRFGHPDPDFSRAAEEASMTISGLVESLNTNLNLYNSLKSVVDDGKDVVPTTEMDDYVAKLFLFDFEQSGIHLEDEKRNYVVQLHNYIMGLGQKFVSGVSKPKYVPLGSLPQPLRNIFPNDGHNAIISGLFSDSSNPQVRETAYRLYLHPDADQERILAELLTLRHELARVCGFSSYAERALRGSILTAPSQVVELIDRASHAIKPKADTDFREMALLKSTEGAPNATLHMWDVPYCTHRAKTTILEPGVHAYAPYFSLGACMKGLDGVFAALFRVRLVNEEVQRGETWCDDVYKLAVVHENEGVLGYIYCDFYERGSKPNQDCHFTIQSGKQLEDSSYQLPKVALMLNFPPPRPNHPTLLTPNMVDNLFHEMGHALHSMLGRTEYQHVSGTRCSTDLAEVPSILMEYFASDVRVVRTFARHHHTNEPMPTAMLQRYCASKRLYAASETQLQLFYAALDQELHAQGPLRNRTTSQVLEQVQRQYYNLPYVENTAWQLRFSHLVGYGAKYYSYLVSRAIAYAIWNRYFKEKPMCSRRGEQFRRECLAHGGGKPPANVVGDFLEAEPSPQFLAQALCTEIEECQQFMYGLK